MHKRILGIVSALLICMVFMMPAYAQDASSGSSEPQPGDASVTVTDGLIGYEQPGSTAPNPAPGSLSTTATATGIYPFEIKYETFGGQPVVIKSFKVEADLDPQTLVETEFEENGYRYSIRDILMTESEMKQESKIVSQTVATSTEDNKDATVMRGFPSIIEFNENGFQGQLLLDRSSVLSTIAGTELYSYPIKKLVDILNLSNNDYAYLEKDLNGLTLQGAEWDPFAEAQRADVLLPGAYNAKAVYTGTGYGTKATGYNNSAVYTGTVVKMVESDSIYSIIYQGTIIQKNSNMHWSGIGIGLLIIAAVGCVVWLLITKFIPSYKIRRKGSGPNVPVAMP